MHKNAIHDVQYERAPWYIDSLLKKIKKKTIKNRTECL